MCRPEEARPPARWFSTELAEEVPPENTWRVLTLPLVQAINLSALSVLGIFSRPCPSFMWTHPVGSLWKEGKPADLHPGVPGAVSL